jgi:hypothetical protein
MNHRLHWTVRFALTSVHYVRFAYQFVKRGEPELEAHHVKLGFLIDNETRREKNSRTTVNHGESTR